MRLTPQVRRSLMLAVALVATIGIVVETNPSVTAAPPLGAPTMDPEEGKSKTLRAELDAAAAGYIEAKARFDASKTLEATLQARIGATKQSLDQLGEEVSAFAAVSYRTGRLGTLTALLDSGSPDDFLNRYSGVEALAMHEDAQLNRLRRDRRELIQQQDRLYAELHLQAEQLATMDKRRKDAEKALAAAGGGRVTGGFVSGNSPAAKPAPRNSDGSWPRESCTVDDPTTTGCLTPRTHHAYLQTKAAGFTRYVSCFRGGGSGEHPKGRACDWAAQVRGFGGVATGGDKVYGDNLATWYVANAGRLGIMYVIWYKKIWMPGLGWRTYNSGNGDPASDHTNHVHLSMY